MKFKIYGTSQCRYCKEAVAFLERKDQTIEYIAIDQDDRARQFIVEYMGLRTVPQIFCDGYHIGGYNELLKYIARKG